MTDSADRVPCATCGESIALEARVCPHCRSSALADVVLAGPVADARLRYQAARALAALGPPAPGLIDAQSALASAAPVVAIGLTRGAARRVIAALEAAGVAGAAPRAVPAAPFSVPAAPPTRSRTLVPMMILGALLGVLIGTRAVSARRAAESAAAAAAAALVAPEPTPLRDPVEIPGQGRHPAAFGPTQSARKLAESALPSTVSLRCPHSVGSGFYVAPELILTNAHVLCGSGERMRVVHPDKTEEMGYPAHSDEVLDLGLVRVPGSATPPLPLGDVDSVHVGDPVLMLGSPMGMEFSVAPGTVSSVDRPMMGVSYVQIDADVNPGNSGGALLDEHGRVVGVVSMKRTDAQGIGLALPINYAYYGSAPFVPPPAGAGRSAGFERMVAAARDAESHTAAELALEAPSGPALLAARMDGDQHYAVLIGRLAAQAPRYEDVTFRLWKDGKRLCSVTTQVFEWKEPPSKRGPVDPANNSMEARTEAWGLKHGLAHRIFAGQASLSLVECPRLEAGMELELVGAEPAMSRTQLR